MPELMQLDAVPDCQIHQWLGAHVIGDDQVRFCVWSPNHQQIVIELTDAGRQITMDTTPAGYHVATVDDLAAGERYLYRIDDGPGRPDPASRFQPDGVHGPSQIIAPAFPWTDQNWQGIDRGDLIIYELHLGTFTQRGTYAAAIQRLEELVDLGVTAIELMPLAATPGKWNWGYDGVNLFAPSANYGTPNDLRKLVDAAHSVGLAVILDVVYNHLGPEGNYLADFGPYLSPRHTTPWGSAPNFDDPESSRELRRFFVANAVHWLDEYHFDGLRVDAIHCMRDDSEPHVAAQIADAATAWSAQSGRQALLIAESNVHDEQMLVPRSEGGIGFHAQWSDDFLHSVYAVTGSGENRCHRNYTPDDLQHTLQYGFVYAGTLRNQRGRFTPPTRVDTSGLIYSIQTHDFVGNDPNGARLHHLVGKDVQRATAALLFLSPAIPMLFMGEEFACEHRFRFFVDFEDEQLRQAVIEGRKSEYPQHDWSKGHLPIEPATFQQSKIGPADEGDTDMRAWYRELIALRKVFTNAGLISDANLTVQTDKVSGLYLWRYATPQQELTVAVRLNQPDEDADPIPFADPGQLILNSHAASTDMVLSPNQAKVFAKKL